MDESAWSANPGLEHIKEYPYLMMYAPGCMANMHEAVPGKAWLQGQILLLGVNFSSVGDSRSNYCTTVFETVDHFVSSGLELGTVTRAGDGQLNLPEAGRKVAEDLWDAADKRLQSGMSAIKELTNDMSRDELASFVRSEFPEETNVRDLYNLHDHVRIDAACSLFQRQKITMSKAAIVAGMGVDGFCDELGRRGIPEYVATVDRMQESMNRIEGTV